MSATLIGNNVSHMRTEYYASSSLTNFEFAPRLIGGLGHSTVSYVVADSAQDLTKVHFTASLDVNIDLFSERISSVTIVTDPTVATSASKSSLESVVPAEKKSAYSIAAKAWDMRGYGLLGSVITLLVSKGAAVASLDIGLIFTLVAVSKDGPTILGHMGRLASHLSFLKTPLGTAILMALPVKTVTVILGAATASQLAEVAMHATIGLFGLSLALGLWPSVEKRLNLGGEKLKSLGKKSGPAVTAVDLGVLSLLLALGKDGEQIFGSLATSLQEKLPIVSQPWARGLLAIIPIKTTTAMLLAGSSEKRSDIAAKGAAVMATLGAFTFSITLAASSFGASIFVALPIGVLTCYLSMIAVKNYSKTIKDEFLKTPL